MATAGKRDQGMIDTAQKQSVPAHLSASVADGFDNTFTDAVWSSLLLSFLVSKLPNLNNLVWFLNAVYFFGPLYKNGYAKYGK